MNQTRGCDTSEQGTFFADSFYSFRSLALPKILVIVPDLHGKTPYRSFEGFSPTQTISIEFKGGSRQEQSCSWWEIRVMYPYPTDR